MWWLYLDESGDLGFDFVNKKPSKFFTVCIVATSHRNTKNLFRRSIKRTLRNKINHRKSTRKETELKGTSTRQEIKEYAWRQIEDATFGIYAVTLNKQRVYRRLTEDKARVYNYITRQVIDRIPFEKADGNVVMQVDKSKGREQINEFNSYLENQLEGRIDPRHALRFEHVNSEASPGIQWADMFGWGIFRKYERKDQKWFDVFKGKVLFDEQFL